MILSLYLITPPVTRFEILHPLLLSHTDVLYHIEEILDRDAHKLLPGHYVLPDFKGAFTWERHF